LQKIENPGSRDLLNTTIKIALKKRLCEKGHYALFPNAVLGIGAYISAGYIFDAKVM